MRSQFPLIILISFLWSSSVFGQSAKKEEVKWMDFQEALNVQVNQKKPIMVFIYTNWCKFCKMMERDIFQNEKAVKYLNEKFIPVRLNAETKDTIKLNNQVYTYHQEYKTNELALSLLQGKLSYPTTVFITPDNKMQRIPGYLDIVHAEWLYLFFGDKKYNEMSFDAWMKTHISKW